MTTLGPSTFVWLQCDETGALTEGAAAVDALNQALAAPGVTDLVLLVHGWQTDRPGAQDLYRTLWGNVCAALPASLDPKNIVVAGVLWPSKPFNADYDGGHALSAADATGGALAVGGGTAHAQDLPVDRFEQVLNDMKALLGAAAAEPLVKAARDVAAGGGGQKAFPFFAAAKKALGVDENHPDPELAQTAHLFAKADTSIGAQILFGSYAMPMSLPAVPGSGGAQGLGDVVNSVVQGVKNGAAKVLNFMSYWTIKARAGVVGEALGAHVLPTLTGSSPQIRLHLVGHSFGGRLVTAAATAFVPHGVLRLQSMTLLQGAFSHNAMTAGVGPYSAVVGKPPGPIAMTHTHNDLACTLAYPIASRLSGDIAKALGDKDDPFGAMGANGAQLAASLLAPDCTDDQFAPVKGKVNRCRADGYVVKTAQTDAHNNITNPTCGKLVAAVISA